MTHPARPAFPALLLLLALALTALPGCRTPVSTEEREAALKKWERELARFAAADASSPPAPGGTLFVGSSSFRLWKNVAEAFPERRVINRGFGGSQMHELLQLVDLLVWPHEPAEILVYEGDNDIANGKSPRQFMDEFRAFARLVHRRLPEARIYFVSIKPSPSREKLLPQMTEANRLVEAYCRKHSWLEYVDIVTPMLDTEGRPRGELFVSDRLHMNAEGYAIWADVIGRSLRAETEAAR